MRTTVIALIACLGFAVSIAEAQSNTGEIRGRVLDKNSGDGLAGVTVVATAPRLKGTRSAISDAKGHYRLANLPVGVYEVTFYYADTQVSSKNVLVRLGKTTRLHPKLDTSGGGEMIAIESAPVIDMRPTTRSLADPMRNIPIPGRTFEAALGGAAGAQGDSLGTSFSGSTSLENTYVVDGVTGTEDYRHHGTNPMTDTQKDRFSTFAVDVDTASYAITRTKINSGRRPPPASVRVEEFVNYFRYDYAGPRKPSEAFAVHMDAAPSPFTRGRTLLRVGVAAKRVTNAQRKPANLVFLVDVSGSMSSADKLGLAKTSLRILLDHLSGEDTVALVTYAGNTRVVLEPTPASDKGTIASAIEDLHAGGSTAMGAGIDLAYELAARDLKPNTVSRVIVLSDGDANVGTTGHDAILEAIEDRVKAGVTLTTVGFGMGNYKDHRMEQLANKGNGSNLYIDTASEARKVFGTGLAGTLEVVAKDVKIQVEMNPEAVSKYRLIGYENRDIADEDFRNDQVDAGEIGANHTVTAMYEVELADNRRAPLATVRVRAMKPRGERAKELVFQFNRSELHRRFSDASADFRFASAVAAAAEILRESPHAADWRMGAVVRIARGASRADQEDRQEFIRLMGKAGGIERQSVRLARGRYELPGYIVAGAGVGGLMIRGPATSSVAPLTSLRLGYGRGATDLTVALGAARSVAEATVAQSSAPIGDTLSVYSLGALISHRLLPHAPIHPLGGVGVESLVVSPANGERQLAFAAIARVGLEVVHPTSLGALALGFDATGHLPLAKGSRMPMELDSVITFGTYLDLHF